MSLLGWSEGGRKREERERGEREERGKETWTKLWDSPQPSSYNEIAGR